MRVPAWLLTFGLLMSAAGHAAADPVCEGPRLPIATQPLTSTPYVEFEIAGRRGPWLIDFGATQTALYAGNWPDAVSGGTLDLPGFGFPGIAPGPRTFAVVEGGRPRRGVGAPLGLVGTDLLKDVAAEFHFEEPGGPYAILATHCDRAAPEAAGFLRLSQAGRFSADPASHRSGSPNVPAVAIAFEERSLDRSRPRLADPRRGGEAWAEIDTGYSDTYWPYSVDINEPYLEQLRQLVPALTLVGLVPVAGCGAEDSLREVYVAPGWRLAIVADGPGPRPTIPFDSYHLVVKPKATECGGIGPRSAPAAQLGSSFLRAFGTTIFMPASAEIWIRTP